MQCIREGLPILVVCYASAFVWHTMIEVPFAKLEKLAIDTLLGGFKEHDRIISGTYDSSHRHRFNMNSEGKNFYNQKDVADPKNSVFRL